MLPKQVINVVPAGAGVAEMKEEYGQSPDLARRLRHGAADCLCQRGEPAAGTRGRAPNANCSAARRGRQHAANHRPGAARECPAGGRGRPGRSRGRSGGGAAAAGAGIPKLALSPHQHPLPSPMVLAFAFGVALLTGIIFGAAPAWFAYPDRSGGSPARFRPQHDRPLRVRSQGAAHRAGGSVGGVGGRRDHAGAKSQQAGAPEPRVPDGRARGDFVEPAAGHLHAAQVASALSAAGGSHERAAWSTGRASPYTIR
jgi:hypothetical protein